MTVDDDLQYPPQTLEKFYHYALASPLSELGLDSLDLVQLRNGFQKAFKLNVPMATFTNANQTLTELIDKLAAKF